MLLTTRLETEKSLAEFIRNSAEQFEGFSALKGVKIKDEKKHPRVF